MLSTKLIIFLALSSSAVSVACGQDAEKARLKLGQMDIPYTEDSFIELVSKGDGVAVNLFLEAGMGATIGLIPASKSGQLDMLKLLLENGANVNTKGRRWGHSALMVAVEGGYLEVVKELIKRGANVNAKNNTGNTALMLVAGEKDSKDGIRKYRDILNLLVENKADVNATNKFGWTILMTAATIGDTSRIRALLNSGADVKSVDQKGMTARKVAEMGEGGNYKQVAQILKEAEALVTKSKNEQ